MFGPVLAVQTFETEQEAIQLANNTPFGLAAAVMTQNEEQAERVTNALRAGIFPLESDYRETILNH